jgi:hypothetical protein
MGKRGPAPKGEYGRKTAVLSFRMQPDTRSRLDEARKDSKRSLTQETEHRLRRTFIDDDRAVEFYGSKENEALIKLIGLVIQATSSIKRVSDSRKSKSRWLDDPDMFDEVLRGIVNALEQFRPQGKVTKTFKTQTAKFAALTAVREIQEADPSLSIMKGSLRQHAMSLLKSELGELVNRPEIFGHTAHEAKKLSDLGKEFMRLHKKIVKTNEESGRHRALWRQIQTIEESAAKRREKRRPKAGDHD